MPALESFRDRFDVGKSGSKLGYVSAMYTVGIIVSMPFTGPACDWKGRRYGTIIGIFIVVASSILLSVSQNLNQFVVGRFFLGFGVSIARTATGIWCVEVAPPSIRGVLASYYNCTYAVGALIAAAATRGSVHSGGDAAWRIPMWCQLICPSIVLILSLFFPESPRWLFANKCEKKAAEFLTKYHGGGDPSHPLVQLQLDEYRLVINVEGSDKHWWDYRDLYNTRAARWRMLNALIPSVWGQCSGNSVVSYYLPAMLATTGVIQAEQILNINLGYTVVSAVAAYTGASLMDKMGRRRVTVWTPVACSLCFAGIAGGAGAYASSGSTHAAAAGIAFIFLFGFCYNFGMTPLQGVYPVECLAYEQRAKGLAAISLFVHSLAFINQYCFPISLQKIAWYTYLVFIGWDLIEAGIGYMFSVETKRRSLEEVTAIFEASDPVKASLRKGPVVVDNGPHETVEKK